MQLVSGQAGVSAPAFCLLTPGFGGRLIEDLLSPLRPLPATLSAWSYHNGRSDREDVDHAVLHSHSIVRGNHVAQHSAVEESSCNEAHMTQHHQHQPCLHKHLPEVAHTQATCRGQLCQGQGWSLSCWAEEKTEALAGVMDIGS